VQFSELRKPHDLDLGSGHTAYRRVSLINLYLHRVSKNVPPLTCYNHEVHGSIPIILA